MDDSRGFQEAGETLAEAVEREVLEETGVRGRATRLVALRSLAAPRRSDTYCAFALEDRGGEPGPDGREAAEAAFRPLGWALHSPEVSALSRVAIAEALRPSGFVALDPGPGPPRPGLRGYVVYASPPGAGTPGGPGGPGAGTRRRGEGQRRRRRPRAGGKRARGRDPGEGGYGGIRP